jgi:hypothetical protein
LSKVCDELVIKNRDPLVIQPASLEVAIIRKKPGEELVSGSKIKNKNKKKIS